MAKFFDMIKSLINIPGANIGKTPQEGIENTMNALGNPPTNSEKAHNQRVEDIKERQEGQNNIPETGIGAEIPIINQEQQQGSFNVQQWTDNVEKWRNEQWAREDAIRKETQEREDSSLQRWVEDARKAGINPNLAIGAQGAPSGGGITNSTGIDTSLIGNAMDGNIEAFIQENQAVIDKALMELEQAFEKGQNNTDRVIEIIGDLLRLGGMVSSAMLFRK